MTQIQQGDVILQSTKIESKNLSHVNDPVLQHGEATGHAHRICMLKHDDKRASGGWEVLLEKETQARFLRVTETIEVRHEEHKPITVPPGEYEIKIVREYDHFAEEARNVVD